MGVIVYQIVKKTIKKTVFKKANFTEDKLSYVQMIYEVLINDQEQFNLILLLVFVAIYLFLY